MKIVGDEERSKLLTEARMIQAASPVIFPMLERRRELAIQRLLASYRDGKHDTNSVAEIFIIESMQKELQAKLQNLTLIKGS